MEMETIWFLGSAVVVAGGWCVGRRIGAHCPRAARVGIVGCVLALLAWGWLMHHPSAATRLIPVSILSRIEGFGSVPLFMMLLGIAWARAPAPRQRQVIGWAMLFGAVYFVNGGYWLLQETPSAVMGQGIARGPVYQSQAYTCVPAACATALNLLEIEASEAEMAELTRTRPGTGSTIIRAPDGLERKLAGQGIRPILLQATLNDLHLLPMPALTPLQFEPTRLHMVTISRVDHAGVYLIDPVDGFSRMSLARFAMHFRGQVILFEPAR